MRIGLVEVHSHREMVRLCVLGVFRPIKSPLETSAPRSRKEAVRGSAGSPEAVLPYGLVVSESPNRYLV